MNIRNIAIIAHVDHGKTTLVDALLRQSNTILSKDLKDISQIMDSNASVVWKGVQINIIDTPGHADFGGEVERVLKMADGSLLLVDAKEGPMPQTRFVLKHALALGHKIIVVINKIDKPDARPEFALEKTYELFLELGTDDTALDFPVIYSAARFGKAGFEPDLNAMTDISPLFDIILKQIPASSGDADAPFQMLITSIKGDNFKGRVAVGRVYNGVLKAGQEVARIDRNGVIKKFRLTSLMSFEGLSQIDVKEVSAGDIAAVSGISDIMIGETVADINNPVALPLIDIEEPTIKMNFSVNDSPFAGQEGDFCTSRQIRERLYKELENDMALRVEDGERGDFVVSGRGELHLAIFIERMRREGYEFQVSRPQVIVKDENGKKFVPYETVFIETPEEYQGAVIQKMGIRHGELKEMKVKNGIAFLEFLIPTRGLFGYRGEFMIDTKGLGIMNSAFSEFKDDFENWRDKEQGSLVAHESGVTNSYGLLNAPERGTLFYGPAVKIYQGQVVGQNSRKEDLRVNVCKTKELSNIPKIMGLEDALEYIADDELVEITPKNIRIRKAILDENEERRKKALGLK